MDATARRMQPRVGVRPRASTATSLALPDRIPLFLASRDAFCVLTPQGIDMNKDQVKGAVKDAAGTVQRKTGKLVGSADMQRMGLEKEIEGKVQKSVGGAKEVAKDLNRKP
jgi:uncharacterized protein YjbJ (UPF0337 family)